MQTIKHRGPHAASARLVTDNHFSRTWMGDRVDWEALWVSGKLVEKTDKLNLTFHTSTYVPPSRPLHPRGLP